MKTKLILTSALLGLFLIFSSGLNAQDITKTSSKVSSKVLLENDQVRVLKIESPVGETTALHSHPAYVLIPLSDGKLEETVNGKKVVTEFKAGEPKYFPAVTHTAKNIGTTPTNAIIVELKTAPKASTK